jgi:hypothetical protein
VWWFAGVRIADAPPLLRDVVPPGEAHRDREPKREQHDDQPHRPRRQPKGRGENRSGLQNDETRPGVDRYRAENLPATEFAEDVPNEVEEPLHDLRFATK